MNLDTQRRLLDDIFFEMLYDAAEGHNQEGSKTYLSQQDGLDDTKINELSDYFCADHKLYRNLEILSKDEIKKEIKRSYERLIDSPSASVEKLATIQLPTQVF